MAETSLALISSESLLCSKTHFFLVSDKWERMIGSNYEVQTIQRKALRIQHFKYFDVPIYAKTFHEVGRKLVHLWIAAFILQFGTTYTSYRKRKKQN